MEKKEKSKYDQQLLKNDFTLKRVRQSFSAAVFVIGGFSFIDALISDYNYFDYSVLTWMFIKIIFAFFLFFILMLVGVIKEFSVKREIILFLIGAILLSFLIVAGFMGI